MDATTNLSLTIKLQDFYGQPVVFLPSQLLPTSKRVYLKGKINLHDFEAIGEPWRDGHHLLIIPDYLLKNVWMDVDAQLEISAVASAIIPKLQLPDRMKRLFQDNPDYARVFTSMTDSDQRQYLHWINAAKSPHEQEQRINATIKHVRSMLHLGAEYHLLPGAEKYLA